MDPRVASAEALPSGPNLMAGRVDGLIRPHFIARLLGVPLEERCSLLAWIEAQELYIEPPTVGPLHERPSAGCVDAQQLSKALQQAASVPFVNSVGIATEVAR